MPDLAQGFTFLLTTIITSKATKHNPSSLTPLLECQQPFADARRLPFFDVERRWRDVQTKAGQWGNERGEIRHGENVAKATALKISTLQHQ